MPGLAILYDPVPLFAVATGAFAIATLQIGWSALPAALSALSPLFSARPDVDRHLARSAARNAARVAREEGLPRAERVARKPAFVAEAVRKLADCNDVDEFSRWLDEAITDRADRHARTVAFWDAVADAAPALGMAGTILGLIGMFANMADPESVGPAMALALMTTFYGLILANFIAAPVARRLARLSEQEIAWQREFAARLHAIAARETTASPSFRYVAPQEAA